MSLPSVEDVNTTRLARFDDAITEALGASERVDFFRDVVSHYVREHDVPEVDVAAALAVVLQGDEPLLLDPARERPTRPDRAERSERSAPDRPDRPGKAGRHSRRSDVPLATYRISVGKRHKVEPRQIVGAIANEGGLRRTDFGAITIRPDFSLVELPADLPGDTWDALRSTRISGKLIDLRRDDGPPGRAPRDETSGTGKHKKPRHKKP
jgi:ATP-dependent RNA helicase DeaD